MESRKTFNTNIVDDVLRFLMDIYMPSSDQWFRSDDQYKSWGGVLLKISSGQSKSSGQVQTLRLLPKRIWKKSEYMDPREFYNLSNEG
jgi:hypothetical protein